MLIENLEAEGRGAKSSRLAATLPAAASGVDPVEETQGKPPRARGAVYTARMVRNASSEATGRSFQARDLTISDNTTDNITSGRHATACPACAASTVGRRRQATSA